MVCSVSSGNRMCHIRSGIPNTCTYAVSQMCRLCRCTNLMRHGISFNVGFSSIMVPTKRSFHRMRCTSSFIGCMYCPSTRIVNTSVDTTPSMPLARQFRNPISTTASLVHWSHRQKSSPKLTFSFMVALWTYFFRMV